MVTDAIIFDFDDTLVATNVIFEDLRKIVYIIDADVGGNLLDLH